jgi:hypothetical protein
MRFKTGQTQGFRNNWCLPPTLAVFWLYLGVNKFLHKFKFECKKYTKSRQIEIVNELQLELYALLN